MKRVDCLRRPRRPGSTIRDQRGLALLIAVIMLLVLTLAGIALVRSVDTATLIGGNFASRQAALQGSDLGVEAALADLPGYVANPDTSVANRYYATMQQLDANGIPVGINWTAASATTAGSYTYQYVIERMCSGTLPITNLVGNCIADSPVGGGSNAMGDSIFVATPAVYYRVTLRATGPRNTTTYVQAIVAI